MNYCQGMCFVCNKAYIIPFISSAWMMLFFKDRIIHSWFHFPGHDFSRILKAAPRCCTISQTFSLKNTMVHQPFLNSAFYDILSTLAFDDHHWLPLIIFQFLLCIQKKWVKWFFRRFTQNITISFWKMSTKSFLETTWKVINSIQKLDQMLLKHFLKET